MHKRTSEYLIVLLLFSAAKCEESEHKRTTILDRHDNNELVSVNSTDQSLNPSDSANATHYCKYRYLEPYPSEYYKLLTGWSCYNYANPKWLIGGKIAKVHKWRDAQYNIPYIKIRANESLFFDYENATFVEEIKALHLEAKYFQKWFDCAEAAMDCCRNHLTPENIISSEDYPCPAMWDGYTCYDKAQANTIVYKLCPLYLTSGKKFICNLESSKQCNSNGEWNHQTDYLPCSSSFRHRDRHTFHIIIIAVATAFMAPSILIFFIYDNLNKWRIVLHRNLILAIFAKNVLVLISKNVIILDAINVSQDDSRMADDGTWCRVLSFFENLSKNLIFTCMTADAYNSHKTIVRAFSSESNIYIMYGIIAVTSIIPTVIWSILMGVNDVGNCWFADDEGYQWVTDGYKYACLIINMVLLCDIVRVLFKKLGKSTNKKYPGRTIKVTIILIFLFGVPLLISGQRDLFNRDECIAGDIYTYSTYSIEALQGIFMSLFFCYLNTDVLNELKRSWRNTKYRILEGSTNIRHTIRRRTTLVTTDNLSMKT